MGPSNDAHRKGDGGLRIRSSPSSRSVVYGVSGRSSSTELQALEALASIPSGNNIAEALARVRRPEPTSHTSVVEPTP